MKILLSLLLYSILSLTSFALSLPTINDSAIRPIDAIPNVMYKDPKNGSIGCGIPPIAEPRVLFDPNHGLIAWYPFDGNASDMSGNGFDTKINGVTLLMTVFGKLNKAFKFDGENDYIKTEKNLPVEGNDKRTISLWFKTDKKEIRKS